MSIRIARTLGPGGLGIAALLTLSTISPVFGSDLVIRANVPFSFQVRSETLPPGDYSFTVDRQAEIVTIRSSKGSGGMLPFLTTMAASPHSDVFDSHLVFDKMGDSYTLSEVWEPGADGVLVYATKGPHEHHVIHVKR